ncbi:hypothetical protein [Streptomyces sp. WAC05374]|uniref:hypothetical protein n=1 Tax=Streptomyces sp. WAC05374 TaxID=2487420 RepID=UPI001F22003A|nr:hypothetical protein [Streptomyces sp. WAC05374]
MQGQLQAVELARPTAATDRVVFHDVDVFALPAHEVVTRMREHATIEADLEDPASFIAPDLLLSFWRPFEADDDPDEEQGYYFTTILLGRPGYYDTPAEAEERLRRNS